MLISQTVLKPLLVIYALSYASTALSWGDRGHQAISIVAAKIAKARYSEQFAKPIHQKATLLGHLAIVPDALWKGLPKEQTNLLNPTHWVDLEFFVKQPGTDKLPLQLQDAFEALVNLCPSSQLATRLDCKTVKASPKEALAIAGSAPWHIKQLADLNLQAWKEAKALEDQGKKGSKEWTQAIDTGIKYAGLLSHFVGDLAQPQHTSRDHDGWEVNQGGLHHYFETDAVREMDLHLEAEAFEHAMENKPAQDLLGSWVSEKEPNPAATRKTSAKLKAKESHEWQPVAWAMRLAQDSWQQLDRLHQIDKGSALQSPSLPAKVKGEKGIKASRAPAQQSQQAFREFTVERLAMAADALAAIWMQTWRVAGQPDFTGYHSYAYPMVPEPIAPSYLDTLAN